MAETSLQVEKICPACHQTLRTDATECPADGAPLLGLQDETPIEQALAGRYELQGLIGEGGYSRVYRARHVNLEREVAVKVLHRFLRDDPDKLKRFEKEAAALSKLQHKNISIVYDYGLCPDGTPYMVIELIQGRTLNQIKSDKLSLFQCLKIFHQVVEAMEAAHGLGIVHRDIKPSNIMLVKGGPEEAIVKLFDFGIAKLAHEAGVTVTRSGETVGTPAYMSPEQCSGKNLDLRSDIYSLGCVMYQTLTGVKPFNGATMFECMMQHLKTDPPSFSQACPDKKIPEIVEKIVFTCLHRDPAQRYQSTTELKKAIGSAIDELYGSKPKPAPPRFWDKVPRPGTLSFAFISLMVVIVGFVSSLKVTHDGGGAVAVPLLQQFVTSPVGNFVGTWGCEKNKLKVQFYYQDSCLVARYWNEDGAERPCRLSFYDSRQDAAKLVSIIGMTKEEPVSPLFLATTTSDGRLLIQSYSSTPDHRLVGVLEILSKVPGSESQSHTLFQ